jgi:uncharacterized membrane protein YbaN (DUF454 family)
MFSRQLPDAKPEPVGYKSVLADSSRAGANHVDHEERHASDSSNSPDNPDIARGFRRAIYIALAGLFFALAMLGTLLPGLPTTPFLLLTSYFLVRSSPWLHRRVLAMPVVGSVIHEWREKRGVRVRVKVVACVMVVAVVAASFASDSLGTYAKVTVGLLAACGIWVVLRLPTVGG